MQITLKRREMKSKREEFQRIARRRGRSQDGGGIRRGDHFLFYKFIERTTAR